MEPTKFGKYVLIDLIAAGGMAEIYKAVMKTADGQSRSLAVKRILPQFARDEEFISLMIDEAKVMVFMNHPNIVPIVEFGKVDGNYYIAMEYVHGPTLLSLFRRVKENGTEFPVSIALHIVREVADALGYAHRKTDQSGEPLGIVHRDISPANILLSYHGDVKITDFGISKASTQSHHTQIGIIRGKTGYMSPEQTRSGMVIDGRTDLFALGVIFFELLTGERLYKADTIPAALKMIREAPVPSLRQFRPDLPLELDEIAQKALAKDPDDRYQTGEQLRDAINEFLTKMTTQHTLGRRVTHNDLSSFLYMHFPDESGDGTLSIMDDVRTPSREGVGTDAGRGPQESGPPSTSSKIFAVNPWFENRFSSPNQPPPTDGAGSEAPKTETMMASGGDPLLPLNASATEASIRPVENNPSRFGLYATVLISVGLGLWLGSMFLVPSSSSSRKAQGGKPKPIEIERVTQTPLPVPSATPLISQAKSMVVKLSSSPPGAKLIIDQRVYEAPAMVELPLNRETLISARLEGYKDRSFSYLPDETGEFTVVMTALPKPKSTPKATPVETPRATAKVPPPSSPKAKAEGFLSLGSTPWAEIQINGQSAGNSPMIRKSLPSGKHFIRLTNRIENLSMDYTVDIRPNAEAKCLFDLRKKSGSCKRR